MQVTYLLLLLSISCLPVRMTVENGLGIQGELSSCVTDWLNVQVVRLVEGDNLQFLLPRVALPSKLFARATRGPVKGGFQSCHDPA